MVWHPLSGRQVNAFAETWHAEPLLETFDARQVKKPNVLEEEPATRELSKCRPVPHEAQEVGATTGVPVPAEPNSGQIRQLSMRVSPQQGGQHGLAESLLVLRRP